MKKWFTKSTKSQQRRSVSGPSRRDSSVKYTPLPKTLNELDEGYKELVRELGKR